MSLFDNKSGKGAGKPKKKKVGLPKSAKLPGAPIPSEEPVEAPKPAEPIEVTPAEPVAPVEIAPAAVAAEVAPEPEPQPEPEAPQPEPEPEVPTAPQPEPEMPPAPQPEPEAPAEVPAEPELPAEPEPTPEAEPAVPAEITAPIEIPVAPVHEKVEGWEDFPPEPEPVAPTPAPVPVAPVAGADAEAEAPTGVTAEQAAAAAAAAAATKVTLGKKKRKSKKVAKSSSVVGLGGEHRRKAPKEKKVRRPKAPKGDEGVKPERRKVAILSAFRDPVKRPRYILWTGAAFFIFAAFMIVALGVTSTRWFCSEGCHKVQDDTITAYQHSSHSEISCMACHMPVGSNPVVFILHKAEALGELYLTVTNNYELPLNKTSEVALTMKSTQCTQCHDMALRKATPSEGIIINHEVHAKNGVNCTLCHNRIAHREDFTPTLTDPKSGEPNKPHEQFSSMTACFRCHTQDKAVGPLKAPGTCETCHPKDFKLKPASHLEPGFFPKGHGKLGKEAAARVESATAEQAEEGGEQTSGVVPASNKEHEGTLGEQLPSVSSINECNTCHAQKFCDDCHGAPMPHPPAFKKTHGAYGKKNPQACVKCHGRADRFCDECHHNTSLDRKYDKSRSWFDQHPDAVRELGASDCLKCHKPTYCAKCHVSGKPPTDSEGTAEGSGVPTTTP